MGERVRSLGRLLLRALRFEVRIWVSLTRWVARRPDVPAGAEAYGYAQSVTPVIALWVFASAVEIPVVHLVVPWAPVRLGLLVLGVWGLLWMVGLLASYRVYPHLLDGAGLRARQGSGIDLVVPWAAVERVDVRREHLGSSVRALQPIETSRGTELRLPMSGEVSVRLVLRAPTRVMTPQGPLDVVALAVHADDPRAFAAACRTRVAAVST